jgi:hypothetical protein
MAHCAEISIRAFQIQNTAYPLLLGSSEPCRAEDIYANVTVDYMRNWV